MNRTPRLSWKVLTDFFTTWAETYCKNAACLRIDNRPVCSILNLTDFEDRYGPTMFRTMLFYGRKMIRERVGEDPYFVGVISRTNMNNVRIANQLPIDAVTGYALLPNWLSEPVQQYAELIEQRMREWYLFQEKVNVPFFPVASAGWDASMRGEHLPELQADLGFPWSPIVTGVTPVLFGHFLDEAIRFNLSTHPEQNIVFIHAWNEWSESSVVEPSDRFGNMFLEEIQKRAGKFQAAR